MKAIVYNIDSDDKSGHFAAVEQPIAQPEGHDIQVKIAAIAVNPVDYKVRQSIVEPQQFPRILGWDAAGVVASVGEKVSLFKPVERDFYARDITPSNCYATHQ